MNKEEQLYIFFMNFDIEAAEIYFHGYEVYQYINTQAFWRLQEWLGKGMCFELSALAMIILKNNLTAHLCHGTLHQKNGKKIPHAWVEFQIPQNGMYVCDFAWMSPGFDTLDNYLSRVQEDGKLTKDWICSHSEFWSLAAANQLRWNMTKADTSNILLDLSVFGNPENAGFLCFETHARVSNGKYMPPHYRDGINKPISTEIIRFFAENKDAKEPPKRLILQAEAKIK